VKILRRYFIDLQSHLYAVDTLPPEIQVIFQQYYSYLRYLGIKRTVTVTENLPITSKNVTALPFELQNSVI